MNKPGQGDPWEDLANVTEKLRARLPGGQVICDNQGLSSDFSQVFRYAYTSGVPKGLGKSHFARSQWTYHCALAMLETARTMDLLCEFETEGRMDARIVAPESGIAVLFAEWEWSFESVFGAGSELQKLAERTSNAEMSNAFLLSYVEEKDYTASVVRIAQWWAENARSGEIPPTLYLHLVVSDESDRFALRSCSILPSDQPGRDVEVVCSVRLGFTG